MDMSPFSFRMTSRVVLVDFLRFRDPGTSTLGLINRTQDLDRSTLGFES